jgi:hypothetical protein
VAGRAAAAVGRHSVGQATFGRSKPLQLRLAAHGVLTTATAPRTPSEAYRCWAAARLRSAAAPHVAGPGTSVRADLSNLLRFYDA